MADENNSIDEIQQAVAARVEEEAADIVSKNNEERKLWRFVRDCLRSNERGDGALYAELLRGKFVFNAAAGEWLYWTGHYWKRDTTEKAAGAVEVVAMEYVAAADRVQSSIDNAEAKKEKDLANSLKCLQSDYLKRANKLRSINGMNACLKAAVRVEDGLSIYGDELDQNPWLLACANGVVDLRNGMLRDGRPDDWITMASPIEYPGLDADTSTWEKIVLEIFNDRKDVLEYVRKTLGYAITGLNKVHDFFAWHGAGRNGKSLIFEAVASTLGPLCGPIPAEMLLEQPGARAAAAASPDIMMLRGLRIAYASETDEGRKFSSSRVKWLTGGDRLTGRWPHDKYPVTFEPAHTLFLLTNHKPRAGADDFAFWERCRLLRFELSFVKDREPDKDKNERKADTDLPEKLREMGPIILAWLVNGCLEWQHHGHLTPPPFVREATAEYRREEDLVQEWMDARANDDDPGAETKASVLYNDFEQWYQAEVGKKAPSPKWFGKQLMRRFDKTKKSTGFFYIGLRLEETYEM